VCGAREFRSSWIGLQDRCSNGGVVAGYKAKPVKCSGSARPAGDSFSICLHSGSVSTLSSMSVYCLHYGFCLLAKSLIFIKSSDFESHSFTNAAQTICNSLSVTTRTASSIFTFRTDLFAKAYVT